MGMAGNSCVCVLPRRSIDPGADHSDDTYLRSSSMAYGSSVLGLNDIYYIYQHHNWTIPTQVRRINSYNPHPRFLRYSPSFGNIGVTSGCFRSLQNLPGHKGLVYTRSFVHDRDDWVCLLFYGYVAFPFCQSMWRYG